MTTSIGKAQELIRSVADHADPVAELQRIIDEAPPEDVPFLNQMGEALWNAMNRLAAERGRK
ncbi:hypothetical protein ACTTAI_13315 [Rhodobacter capsulatus]|uniref:hypothetical protein n=1 Tax=Rhodobacter capsulatus TaxID=1061 RepID=UPI0040272D44